jgi:hypothetical protein
LQRGMTDMRIDMLIASQTIDELGLTIVFLCKDVDACGTGGRSGTDLPLR